MCNWLRERIEREPQEPTREERLQMLDRVTYAESFENFIGLKYGSYKRFGLDGCEALIPGMKTMIDRVTELGTEYIVIGMPHRCVCMVAVVVCVSVDAAWVGPSAAVAWWSC